MGKKKDFLYMHHTGVSPEKTASEITQLLIKQGATGVMLEANQGNLIGLRFEFEVGEGKKVPIRLPVRATAVRQQLQAARRERGGSRVPRTDMEQARRTAWRMVKRWIEAQLAYVATGQVQVIEVFLPYILTKDGETLFRTLQKGGLDRMLDYTPVEEMDNDR